MKKIFDKFNTNFLSKIFVSLCAFSMLATPVFADGVLEADSPGKLAWSIIRFVFGLVAPVLAIFGAYKIAIGIGQDKPEEKTKGVQMAVTGAMIQLVVSFNLTNYFAGSGDLAWWGSMGRNEGINEWINKLLGWVVGLGVALLGYALVKFAISFQNDDTGARVKSYQQAVTGGIIAGISTVIRIIIPGVATGEPALSAADKTIG
ncbi:hypothetical protein, partial [Treponema sp. R6D11]